ncbi:hypothetical protein DFS34DRAFT_201480 [Phlyctochytrium arcticum]|nr:hypothetical protein DFS34DRAFT_201480 [Phlyctochytrium arcticum]
MTRHPLKRIYAPVSAKAGLIIKSEIQEFKTSAYYRKIRKGHIIVFPSNVQDLASNVLPHPLAALKSSIARWPFPTSSRAVGFHARGASAVRPARTRAALHWLQANNDPLITAVLDATVEESWSKASRTRPSSRPYGRKEHGATEKVHGLLGCPNLQCIEQSRTPQIVTVSGEPHLIVMKLYNRDVPSTHNIVKIVRSVLAETGLPLIFRRGSNWMPIDKNILTPTSEADIYPPHPARAYLCYWTCKSTPSLGGINHGHTPKIINLFKSLYRPSSI